MSTYEDDDDPPSSDERLLFVVAGRDRRLGAALIDALVALLIGAMIRSATGGNASDVFPTDLTQLKIDGVYAACVLVPFVPQVALLARYGQSFGKLVLNIRIVDEDGRTARIGRAFLFRTLPISLVALLTVVALAAGVDLGLVSVLSMGTGLVAILDVLFIFGDHNRTLHDRLAGTYVCVVGTQRILNEQIEREERRRRAKKRKAIGADGPRGARAKPVTERRPRGAP